MSEGDHTVEFGPATAQAKLDGIAALLRGALRDWQTDPESALQHVQHAHRVALSDPDEKPIVIVLD